MKELEKAKGARRMNLKKYLNIKKYLDTKYVLIVYVLGIGMLGLFLVIQYGWWGLAIESIIVLILSFPLAYWLLKKWELIDWAKDLSENKLLYGLEIMKRIKPKKAKEYEEIVKQHYQERNQNELYAKYEGNKE